MGPNISLYHSKLLPKSAYYGTITPWHQDYSYWKGEDNQPLMINCMFFMDAATTENGCIQFVPGSHKKGLLDHNRGNHSFGYIYLVFLRDAMILYQLRLTPEIVFFLDLWSFTDRMPINPPIIDVLIRLPTMSQIMTLDNVGKYYVVQHFPII